MDMEDRKDALFNELILAGAPLDHAHVVLSASGVKKMIKDYSKKDVSELAATKARCSELEDTVEAYRKQVNDLSIRLQAMEAEVKSKVSLTTFAEKVTPCVEASLKHFLAEELTQTVEKEVASVVSSLDELVVMSTLKDKYVSKDELAKELDNKVSVEEFVQELKKQLKTVVSKTQLQEILDQVYNKDEVKDLIADVIKVSLGGSSTHSAPAMDGAVVPVSDGINLLRSI